MSELKTAALHIGAHKTGTSVVQKYQQANVQWLAGHGIEVILRDDFGECIDWGERLVHRPELMAELFRVFTTESRHDYLVTSNENVIGRPFVGGTDGRIYPNGPRNIRALAAIPRACRLRLVLSIRPQHEFVESYYLQTVHEGGTKTLDKWLEGVDFSKLSWRPLVEAMEQSVGPENVDVVDFGLIKAGQPDYLRRFLTAAKPDFDGVVEFERVHNRSVSEKGLNLARAVNPYLNKNQQSLMRRFLQKHFSNVDYPRPVLLSDDQRQELIDRYAAEYAELSSRASGVSPQPASTNPDS